MAGADPRHGRALLSLDDPGLLEIRHDLANPRILRLLAFADGDGGNI